MAKNYFHDLKNTESRFWINNPTREDIKRPWNKVQLQEPRTRHSVPS